MKPMKKQFKYLAFDAAAWDFEPFDTIEEARKWILDGLSEGYIDPDDLRNSKIYTLHETIEVNVVDDEPDVDEDATTWPGASHGHLIITPTFVPFKEE